MKIKITTDYHKLWRIGGERYMQTHYGKIYEAEIHEDGWAYIDNAKFHPDTFTVIKDNDNE